MGLIDSRKHRYGITFTATGDGSNESIRGRDACTHRNESWDCDASCNADALSAVPCDVAAKANHSNVSSTIPGRAGWHSGRNHVFVTNRANRSWTSHGNFEPARSALGLVT